MTPLVIYLTVPLNAIKRHSDNLSFETYKFIWYTLEIVLDVSKKDGVDSGAYEYWSIKYPLPTFLTSLVILSISKWNRFGLRPYQMPPVTGIWLLSSWILAKNTWKRVCYVRCVFLLFVINMNGGTVLTKTLSFPIYTSLGNSFCQS